MGADEGEGRLGYSGTARRAWRSQCWALGQEAPDPDQAPRGGVGVRQALFPLCPGWGAGGVLGHSLTAARAMASGHRPEPDQGPSLAIWPPQPSSLLALTLWKPSPRVGTAGWQVSADNAEAPQEGGRALLPAGPCHGSSWPKRTQRQWGCRVWGRQLAG